MHMHVENLCILLPKNYIEIDIPQIRCHQSTQCHGHDQEAADLTVYLAITVSTFFLHIYIYTYIYIYIHFYMDNFFHKITCAFLFAIVVVCNVSKTLFKIGAIGLSV